MEEILKKRTKAIGVNVIKLVEKMNNNIAQQVISKQVIRSATSVGANYRAVCRAKSEADFINKLRIVEEEADETLFWLEILEELAYVKNEDLKDVAKETNEILSIVVASINTTLKKNKTIIQKDKK